MPEATLDQASGLRRVMAQSLQAQAAIVNLLGAGDHPAILARLVQIWADEGLKVTVITDFDRVFQVLHANRRRFGLTVLHALESGLARHGIERLAAESDLTVLALDDNRLARGVDGPDAIRLVLSGTSTESVATAYARLKATAGLGSSPEVCTLFDRSSVPDAAMIAHRRFALAANRFLGICPACAGMAPEATDRDAWKQLASEIGRWATGQTTRLRTSAALH